MKTPSVLILFDAGLTTFQTSLNLAKANMCWPAEANISQTEVSGLPFGRSEVSARRCRVDAFLLLVCLFINAGQAQTVDFALGTYSLLVDSAPGSNSVILAVTPPTASWIATANAGWLHLCPTNERGIGNATVVFGYDPNGASVRSGTLTIGDQLLTVTQVGSNYVAVTKAVSLVSTGLTLPYALAVDTSGNVYIPDLYNNAIKKWTREDNSVSTLAQTSINPQAVAVDTLGNVYFPDAGTVINRWSAATSNVTTVVTSLHDPCGLTMDAAGDLYISDTWDSTLREWSQPDNGLTILLSTGLSEPIGISVDRSGDVYIADTFNNAIKRLSPLDGSVQTLVSNLSWPEGVAVDGSGNVYIADTYSWLIKMWAPASSTVTTFRSLRENHPQDVVVDDANNLYIADTYNSSIEELPHAFVDPTLKLESASGGADSLPPFLPTNASVLQPLQPSTDQPWLLVTGTTNGVVSFNVNPNPGLPRVGHVSVFGVSIPIVQLARASPPLLTVLPTQTYGIFQFAFEDSEHSSFTVLCNTNVSLPVREWTVVGTASNVAGGLFQFTAPQVSGSQQFYMVRSP